MSDEEKSKSHESVNEEQNAACSSASDDLLTGGCSEMKKTKLSSDSENSPISSNPQIMVAASPPKFVPLKEIMEAARGVRDMNLVHEIANDPKFELKTPSSPPENSVQKQVSDVMKRAFWDSLRESLADDPPDYTHAVVLLEEVKQKLLDFLMPHQTNFRSHIESTLDMELIKQQVKHNQLDINQYGQFIISCMAKLCAPVRDEQLDEVRRTFHGGDIVEFYKEVFKLIDVMQMDMANFTIQQMRPYIQQHSVEYERKKFEEFIKKQEDNNIDGLVVTKSWLTKKAKKLNDEHLKKTGDDNTGVGFTPASLLNRAYVDLLTMNVSLIPETLLMDLERIVKMQKSLNSLLLSASVVLVTFNTVGASIVGIKSFKDRLKSKTFTIISNSDERNITDTLKGVASMVKSDVQATLKSHGFSEISSALEESLIGQIASLSESHPVYSLLETRINSFLLEIMCRIDKKEICLPVGFSSFSEELASICGPFLRLAANNRTVFGPFYAKIISSIMETYGDSSLSKSNSEASTSG